MPHNINVGPLNRLELSWPVLSVVRPGNPRCLVRLPFGGHAIAESGWGFDFQGCDLRLVEKAMCDGAIAVDSAVAQERPVAARFIDGIEIDFSVEDFLLIMGRLGQHAPKGIAEKRSAPELKAGALRFVAAYIAGFVPDSVYHGDKNSIGDGMCALDGAPGIMLDSAILLLFRRMPSDGC